MKCYLFGFAILLSSFSPQDSFKSCDYKYFKGTKKVSSSICYDDNQRWGEAKAFDKEGKEIYKRQLRKMAGHAHVTFKYYESGGIKEAYFSDAPDAGIQWYHETVYFDEKGNQTDIKKESNEDLIHPRIQFHEPEIRKVITPALNKDSASNQCITTYSNEFWIENKSKQTVLVEAAPKKQGANYVQIILKPKSKERLTLFGNAYSEQDPEDYFIMQASYISTLKSGKKTKKIASIHFKQKKATHMKTAWWFEVK